MKRVNFETALLAKQYGFNCPCPVIYNNIGEQIALRYWEGHCPVDDSDKFFSDTLGLANCFVKNSHYIEKSIDKVACPTQEELKDWFRVEQNLLIEIFPVTNGSEWMYEIRTIVKTKDNSTHFEPNDYYKSYEECLEYALKKSFEFCQQIPYPKIEY